MKLIIGLVLFAACAGAQNSVRWSATTGDVALSAAGTTATIQQPAANGSDVALDQIQVYCSVACNVTQSANGTAATTTAGTISPLLPAPANFPITATFWTASNVGAGTVQGGITHVGAGGTVVLCLSVACGATGNVFVGRGGGTASNYSVVIGAVTGTVNITMFGRLSQ